MTRRYDFLIVGAGLFGSTCAYELGKRGFRCLVLEKRPHVGGNCYTEVRDGISVHKYGPHIFHTSDIRIWKWITNLGEFNTYRHKVKVNFHGDIYSFPANLTTFNQLWGVTTPEQARAHIARVTASYPARETLEDWALSQVGRDFYTIFIEGYTRKQWNKEPSQLPASILKRLPLRFTFNDDYFDDTYQGIPHGGYSPIFHNLLAHADVLLDTDYFSDRRHFDSLADQVIYTGPIDRFYDYRFGRLQYRGSRFEHEALLVSDYQGIAQMNYTAADVPYTRIVEHKHFLASQSQCTWITREFPGSPDAGQEEMYPLCDAFNLARLKEYKALQSYSPNVYFGGRLAEYRYYDMHQVIASALHLVSIILPTMERPGPPTELVAAGVL